MQSILILGAAGFAGRTQAKLDACKQELVQLKPEFAVRIATCVVDATNIESMNAAFVGIKMVLNVATIDPQVVENVANACVHAHADYLDIMASPKRIDKLNAVAQKPEAKERMFVTEAGYHPGLPAVLVRYAATKFDQDSMTVADLFGLMQSPCPNSLSAEEIISSSRELDTRYYENGEWKHDLTFGKRKNCKMPAPFGERSGFSSYLREMQDVPKMFPSLKETAIYLCGTHWAVDNICYPAVAILSNFLSTWMMSAFLSWSLSTFVPLPYASGVQVHAEGMKGGKKAAYTLSVLHGDGYAITAIPVVAFLRQYLDPVTGPALCKPGVQIQGHLVDPVRFVDDMKLMGADITEVCESEYAPAAASSDVHLEEKKQESKA